MKRNLDILPKSKQTEPEQPEYIAVPVQVALLSLINDRITVDITNYTQHIFPQARSITKDLLTQISVPKIMLLSDTTATSPSAPSNTYYVDSDYEVEMPPSRRPDGSIVVTIRVNDNFIKDLRVGSNLTVFFMVQRCKTRAET